MTLAQARAEWTRWEAAHRERRAQGWRAAEEKYSPVVADLLVDIHLPKLPAPTEVVAYALALECGHEDFLLGKRDSDVEPALERAQCPISWECQLGEGRTAARYL